ncbi:MAG: hypothetical protein ACE5RL_08240 [Nitrosarchaeum sp.]
MLSRTTPQELVQNQSQSQFKGNVLTMNPFVKISEFVALYKI